MIPQKSLWIRYKETNKEKRLLVTHPHAKADWKQYWQSVKIHVDSIQSIGCVTIVSSYKDEPVILLSGRKHLIPLSFKPSKA